MILLKALRTGSYRSKNGESMNVAWLAEHRLFLFCFWFWGYAQLHSGITFGSVARNNFWLARGQYVMPGTNLGFYPMPMWHCKMSLKQCKNKLFEWSKNIWIFFSVGKQIKLLYFNYLYMGQRISWIKFFEWKEFRNRR